MTSTASQLQNHGQIRRMELPDGWEGGPVDLGELDQRSLLEFTPPDATDVRLCFFYRGIHIDDYSGDFFRTLLEAPEHSLSTEELEDSAVILDTLALSDAFAVDSARTVDLNGKRVLAVIGTWLESQRKNWGLFIDADGSGTVIQEIHFVAPSKDYDFHHDEASRAINSIEWR